MGLLFYLQQITKPLLERKRRARINKCLDELKNLMIDALEVRIIFHELFTQFPLQNSLFNIYIFTLINKESPLPTFALMLMNYVIFDA